VGNGKANKSSGNGERLHRAAGEKQPMSVRAVEQWVKQKGYTELKEFFVHMEK